MIKLAALTYDHKDGEGAVFDSPLWSSVERVETLINLALPDLLCPICRAENFTLIQDFEEKLWSPLVVQHRLEASVIGVLPTLSLNCSDCGYILKFSSEELQKRAERHK